MEIIPGGYRHVIVADNPFFNDYTEIKELLKRGTSVVPSTLLEEGGNNETFSAEKKVVVNVTSADNDPDVFDVLKSAEESRTSLYFRFFTMHPHYYLDVLQTEVIADREYVEAGKFNAVTVDAICSGIVESDVLILVYMFNPFNPENL
jgi:hypothetical protein